MTFPTGLIHGPKPAHVPMMGAVMPVGDFKPKKSVDYTSIIPNFPVLGNDEYSDCVQAGMLHLAQIRMANAWRSTWAPTVDQALEEWRIDTGGTTAPGPGTSVATAFGRWASAGLDVGLQTRDVALWLSIDPKNIDHVKLAIDWYCGVGFSLDIPAVWLTMPPDLSIPASGLNSADGAPGSGGGHFVCCAKYDEHGAYVVTWGIEMFLPWDAFAAYILAVDTGFSPDILTGPNATIAGMTRDEAIARMGALV